MQQALWSDMADLLGSDGWNYSVSLFTYRCAASEASDIQAIVKELLGHEVLIQDIRDVDFGEVESELRESLRYQGEPSSGPGAETLLLPEFASLLEKICEDAASASQRASAIKSFRFRKGHPAYPVFWDFAFLFLGPESHEMVVGCSSD
jgi:hypothetical protein